MKGGHWKVPQIHPRHLGCSSSTSREFSCSWGHTFMANEVPAKEGLVGQVSGETCAMLWKESKTEAKDIESYIQWLSLALSRRNRVTTSIQPPPAIGEREGGGQIIPHCGETLSMLDLQGRMQSH